MAVRLRVVDDSRGDPFARVYSDNHDAVWRCLRALGVPEDQVEDALQDVFVVVHRRLPQFDHAVPVRRWIYGIARKVALKYHARRRRPVPRLAVVEPEGAAPEEALARRDAAAVVARFVESLTPQLREVFVLTQLEEMSMPEVAALLGIKINTAYSRLRLARRRFDRVVARHAATRRRGAP